MRLDRSPADRKAGLVCLLDGADARSQRRRSADLEALERTLLKWGDESGLTQVGRKFEDGEYMGNCTPVPPRSGGVGCRLRSIGWCGNRTLRLQKSVLLVVKRNDVAVRLEGLAPALNQ